MNTLPAPDLPPDATDAEREAFAAANRERYAAAIEARDAAETTRILAMLRDLDAAYERPVAQ